MKETNNTRWYNMDFSCTSSLNTKLIKLLTSLLVCCAFLASHNVRAEAGPPSGQGVQPVQYNGNPTCADFYGIPDLEEFKIEPVADGVYSDGELEVAISVQELSLIHI